VIAQSRLRLGAISLLVLAVAGTLGYMAVEGASPLDALYMVLITITTVGFSEVIDLSPAGRVLTMVIMVTGVGLGLYTAGAGIERLFSIGASRLKIRQQRMIDTIKDHVILCGFGRVGRGVWESLTRRGIDVVVIESNPDHVASAEQAGALVVEGDATHNDPLINAGIDRARALVACVTEDSDNLVIVLSAKSMRQDLHLVSRASEVEWEDKLRMAGADRVVAPQVVGSERLAAMAVEPHIADVFDVVVGGLALEFTVEELRIPKHSPLVGVSIREAGIRERSGANVLAVEDPNRGILTAPSPDHVLEGGIAVILVGTRDQVLAAEQLFEGHRPN
jgi:voltage-gated potassium channel